MNSPRHSDDQRPAMRTDVAADFDDHTVGAVGRSAMIGALAGSIGLGTLMTVGSVAATASLGEALGMGVAVALTGGPFFGALVGFALAVRSAEHEAARRLVQPATVTV